MAKVRVAIPLLLLFFLLGSSALAQAPLAPADVPVPLKPWIGWSLRGHEAVLCPADVSDDSDRICLWPARLSLELNAKGGRFSQSAKLFREMAMPLPGDATAWPQDVRVDGKSAPVVDEGGTPVVWLKPGEHSVMGNYIWAKLPESIHIPESTGLVSLHLRGQSVPFPSRENGLLWLQREQEDEQGESRLDVKVWRLVTDSVPMRVVTRVQLEVSGKNREVLLGRALIDGFIPISIDSQLPARLEPDGRLRVQVRPGTFRIELAARNREPVTALTLARDAQGPWSADELWAFSAAPDLRVVEIAGVASIDPAQTTLPDEWRSLPAYRVQPGETMRFNVQRRGDAEPAPDQLTLSRALWLDFDGKGITARDQLSGTLTRSDRLEMPAPSELGRVRTQGKDQLITRLQPDAAPGVELRQGILQLAAESREELRSGSFAAVGWSHGVRGLSAQLNLPAGWRLLHASGADEVSPTWIQSWSLLDLFLLLLASIAAGRLFGWPIGAVTLVALGLALPEDSPKWLWLLPLAAEALLRVVPVGKIQRLLLVLRGAALIVLVLALTLFAVHHLRVNLYPALARDPGYIEDNFTSSSFAFAAAPAPMRQLEEDKAVSADGAAEGTGVAGVAGGPAAPPPSNMPRPTVAQSNVAMRAMKVASASASVSGKVSANAYAQQLDLTKIDPNAAAQTGPGVPEWSWNLVSLRWSGPVEAGARVRLWLLSPGMNLFLAFLRVLLLAFIWLKLLSAAIAPGGGLRGLLQRIPKRGTAVAAMLFALALPGLARADEIPSDAMITELGTRLTQPPQCGSSCLSSPRMIVEASGSRLRLRIELDALAPMGAPLPGSLNRWSPDTVLLDGKPASALERSGDGTLLLALETGVHQVTLEGPLPARDDLELSLPLLPKQVESKLAGFTLDGVHDDGTPEETLRLSRIERGAAKNERLEPGQLPPAIEVERDLLLGMTWQISTHVRRRSPTGSPISIEIPLLPGESITSAEVRAQNGKAQLAFGPHTDELTWTSSLTEAPRLVLTAIDDPAVSEVWRLEVAPTWHVDAKGIPPVHQEAQAQRVPAYRPWPRETLTLDISRPAPVAGASITIQSSELTASPGARTSDVLLVVRVSTSRGGPTSFTLPAGAELQSLFLDGRALPLQQEGSKVTFTLSPGEHRANLSWREPRPMSALYRMPQPDLGLPSVNSKVHLHLPARWVLFAGGPRLGPAILIWSFVIVMLLCAFGLSRIGSTPLRTHQWALLALGLTQVDLVAAAVVAGWFVVLGWRRTAASKIAGPRRFDLLQILLVIWTVAAAVILVMSIERGLLGEPEMQVAGNSSTASQLNWFVDRSGGVLPGAWVFSLPIFVYRLAMLAWALWLALALVRFLPWAWQSFAAGGMWRSVPKKVKQAKAAAVVVPVAEMVVPVAEMVVPATTTSGA